ncbi:MAG: dephospho-CoA kinase [Anaplasmataceae bacterium]|nr:dephospho-CoA kinase [Anaplasmataceae bacterium]
MRIIGVTGRIASGKNTFASYFVRHCRFGKNIAIFDADIEIKYLYQNAQVIELFKKKLPHLIINNKINFDLLKKNIFNNIAINKAIKNILYPFLYKKMIEHIRIYRLKGYGALILNIPLIYELKADLLCDDVYIIKSSFLQRNKRLIKRNGDIRLFEFEKSISYRQKFNENHGNKFIYNISKNDILNYIKENFLI